MSPARGRCAAFLFLLCALLARDGSAQYARRTGFWMEISTGPGFVRVGCAGCGDVITENGSGGFLRLGGALSSKVLLGVESNGFIDETFGFAPEDESVVAEASSLAAVVLWYPWRAGIFLKGGVGLAGGRFTVPSDSAEAVEATGHGVGMTFGFGLDVPLSRRFALTGNAAAFIMAIGDVRLPSVTVDDVIPTVYQVGIGLTVR